MPTGTIPTVDEQQLPLSKERVKMKRPVLMKLKRLQLMGPIHAAQLVTLLSSFSLSIVMI